MTKLKMAGAAVGALALVWAGLSYDMGGRIEESLAAQLEITNTSPFMSMSIARFERGWFSSEIDIVMKFGLEQDDGQESSKLLAALFSTIGPITLTYNYDHGPIIFGPDGLELAIASMDYNLNIVDLVVSLELPGVDRDALDMIPSDYVFHSWVKLDFDGAIYVQFDAEPLNIVIEREGASGDFQWGGTTGTVDYNISSGRYVADMDFPAIGFQIDESGAKTGIQIEEFHFVMDGVLEEAMVWLGDVSVEIGKFAINSGKEQGLGEISINGVTVKSTTVNAQGEDLLNSSSEFHMDSLTGLESVTEGSAIGPIEWNVEIKNVPRGADEKYLRAVASIGGEQDPEELMRLLPEAINGYLTADPEFNVVSSVINYGGGTITYNHLLAAKTADHFPQNAEQWMAATKYTGTVIMDDVFARVVARQTLARQLGAQMDSLTEAQIETAINDTLAQFMASGFVTKNGKNYRVDMAVTDGVFSVSGNPIADMRALLNNAD